MKIACLLALILAELLCIISADWAAADTFGSGANTFNIEFVGIGNPSNVADTTGEPGPPYPTGSVSYTYRMGKYEISEQMIDNANALGGLGITKDTRGPDKPATRISWNEAARFINWLNTSSGSTPAYKFALQPGDIGYSPHANNVLWTISDTGYNPNNKYRNSQAKYFLPSVDEWYKAAYYNPTSGVYYNFPTGSDGVPDGYDFIGDVNFAAVFSDGGGLNPQPNDITNVGILSPDGTAGQGGNVTEWEETDVDLVNDGSFFRGLRGGSWSDSFSGDLLSTSRNIANPGDVFINGGFRVASKLQLDGDYDSDGDVDGRDFLIWQRGGSPDPLSAGDLIKWQNNYGAGTLVAAAVAIPEPSSMLSAALASVGLLLRRRRVKLGRRPNPSRE